MIKIDRTSVSFCLRLCLIVFLFALAVRAQTLQLDPTFDSDGKLTVGFGETGLRSSYAYYVLGQPSGRVVVYGGHNIGGQFGSYGMATAGVTTAGALDMGFGTGGRILEMNGAVNVQAVESLPNGQSLRLLGVSTLSFPSMSSAVLQRLNLNGSIDGSFAANLDVNADVTPLALSIRADGKILVLLSGVGVDRSHWLVRLNASGSRDTSFGTNGVSLLDLRRLGNFAVVGAHLLADDRVLLGGYGSTTNAPQGGNVAWAVLLDKKGHFDRRFGLQGIYRLRFPYGIRVSKTQLQPDGKIVLIGHARPEGFSQLMLIRLTTRGRGDSGFGTNGLAIAPIISPGSFDVAHSGKLMVDGRIVVAGSYALTQFDRSNFLIARFSSSGVLESHAVTQFTPGFDTVAHDVFIQPDGKPVVIGYTRNPDESADGNLFAIARYTP
jgi:uncharacterized delta-60 repeat protein